MTFSEILSDAIAKVEGIVAISLTGVDGLAVETLLADQSDETFDREATEVELASMVGFANKTLATLGGGAVKELIIDGENRSYFISLVEQDYFVLVVMQAGGNLGRARLETRRISQKLRDNM